MKLAILLFFMPFALEAVVTSDRYFSPRNAERPVRRSTELIVLHTTEGAARGSLIKLCERGEAHFCVTEAGAIYRIVERDREAFHAGRSMWNGKEDVDKFAVGIEVVGEHDKVMPVVQLLALRDLVKELQRMYRLGDDHVICHSHVAYGAPNKWQKHRHRGRKRCGMLFAMPSVRRVLELRSRPALDPDTRARRLVVGDPYLNNVLYGGIDTMRAAYGQVKVAATPPMTEQPRPGRSGGFFSGLTSLFSGAGRRDAKSPPRAIVSAGTKAGPRPVTKPKAKPAAKPKAKAVTQPAAKPKAKPAVNPKTKSVTKPTVKPSAKSAPKTVAELRKLPGYALRGRVSAGHSAWSIAGKRWNSAQTYYVIRGKVTSGDQISLNRIEKGTEIWFAK